MRMPADAPILLGLLISASLVACSPPSAALEAEVILHSGKDNHREQQL